MSHFHFEIKAGKRGTSATHFAYINRTGKHAVRNDLIGSEHNNMPNWAMFEPRRYWITSDKCERKNASAFVDITVSLPKALTHQQNVQLAREVGEVLAGRKPHQIAVHAPVSSLEGERNPHAHFMISNRLPDNIERSPEQTFRRYNSKDPTRGGCKKDSGGMNRMQLRDRVLEQRKLVADTINSALGRWGHTTLVDHRTLKQQGIKRKPERYLGPARINEMSSDERKQYVAARRVARAMDNDVTDINDLNPTAE